MSGYLAIRIREGKIWQIHMRNCSERLIYQRMRRPREAKRWYMASGLVTEARHYCPKPKGRRGGSSYLSWRGTYLWERFTQNKWRLWVTAESQKSKRMDFTFLLPLDVLPASHWPTRRQRSAPSPKHIAGGGAVAWAWRCTLKTGASTVHEGLG